MIYINTFRCHSGYEIFYNSNRSTKFEQILQFKYHWVDYNCVLTVYAHVYIR